MGLHTTGHSMADLGSLKNRAPASQLGAGGHEPSKQLGHRVSSRCDIPLAGGSRDEGPLGGCAGATLGVAHDDDGARAQILDGIQDGAHGVVIQDITCHPAQT